MLDNDICKILTDEMDEDTLSKMPLWFGILRKSYRRRISKPIEGREKQQGLITKSEHV
jgi:hypothetical protein